MTKRHFASLTFVGLIVVTVYSMGMVLIASAQPAPVQGGTAQGNMIQTLLGMVTTMLIPALWVSFGPVATKAITLIVNSWTKAYVPRQVQVPLSGILGAIMAGLTGDAAGVDPNVAASIGTAMGLGAQIFASTHPDTMTASAPPTSTKSVG